MPRCIIFCGRPVEETDLLGLRREAGDLVVGADSGYLTARRLGFPPDLILGDFDSAPMPQAAGNVEVHPAHKDETDCVLAVDAGLSRGFTDFVILGGTGGRLDHTVANLQTLGYLAGRGARGELRDRDCWVRVVRDETVTIPRGAFLGEGAYLSLFALGGTCIVTETGVEYPLDRYPLSPFYPLGVSNHILNTAVITAEGTLLVMLCRSN
ncbi:MAG: thiamine diphosphokinase [Angelakisella sp.]|jgi:thiamine pyrophosphokinase|nr:thiamine diphosphokinase [Angelakisella sp.]